MPQLFPLKQNQIQSGLRIFSTVTAVLTFFLIFVGAMVNSTGSGLAVPDWPLSYGSLFPPMVGGVLYEHSHRMVASLVGLCMLILCVCLARYERRRWVRNLGFWALGAVILQGILGGITVLFFLPVPISVAHGILAQTFLVLTIIIAYSQSLEYSMNVQNPTANSTQKLFKTGLTLIVLVYLQLVLAAVMRHTHSGLAITDFPRMGGFWIPPFNDSMLDAINHVRFNMDLPDVQMWQVAIHFIHRVGALVIFIFSVYLTWNVYVFLKKNKILIHSMLILNHLIALQILLGILSVVSAKSPWITSLHVVNGAAILGMSVIFTLRVFPFNNMST